MTQSSLTNQTRISMQRSTRNGTTVDTFLIHHQASTNDDATIAEMVNATKQVSANYTISNEGRLTCVVPEEYRAWTSGSSTDGGKGAAWDRRSITVEIENQTGDPDWKISDAALDMAAKLLHDLKRRYTIRNVLGHRDLWNRYQASYPTYCPGPNTVSNIVAREAKITGGSPAPSPSQPSSGWKFVLPSAATQKRVQAALRKRGRYSGPVDGAMGSESLKGVQRTIVNVGYTGPIDGVIAETGCRLIQVYAKQYGSYSGPVDSVLGENSWIGFATGLERP